jgi:hypothetical protein
MNKETDITFFSKKSQDYKLLNNPFLRNLRKSIKDYSYSNINQSLDNIQERGNKLFQKICTKNVLLMSRQEETKLKISISEHLVVELRKLFQFLLNFLKCFKFAIFSN